MFASGVFLFCCIHISFVIVLGDGVLHYWFMSLFFFFLVAGYRIAYGCI